MDINLFPARSFLSKLIVGVPAQTEASKRKLVLKRFKEKINTKTLQIEH